MIEFCAWVMGAITFYWFNWILTIKISEPQPCDHVCLIYTSKGFKHCQKCGEIIKL